MRIQKLIPVFGDVRKQEPTNHQMAFKAKDAAGNDPASLSLRRYWTVGAKLPLLGAAREIVLSVSLQ